MEKRTYIRNESIAFRKTAERFGGLSNMAPGFPLEINGVKIRTSEALYQACRFPNDPDIQLIIIEQLSPMTAKMKSKPYRKRTRPDWDIIRVSLMRWCLRVKLAQNWARFSSLLLSTGDKPIVEESNKDAFWGAKPINAEKLIGFNVLGRLLMELREELRTNNNQLIRIKPPMISNFLLLGEPVGFIDVKRIPDEKDKLSTNTSENSEQQLTLFNLLQGALIDINEKTVSEVTARELEILDKTNSYLKTKKK